MDDLYKTIDKPSEGIYKEKLSKFLAFAFPVSSEEQIKDIQKDLRKKYYDARHHVYAFMLGINKDFYRYSDDGEPSNSSGPSVLNAIKSFDLTNILIVVVRYFGGKKLGVPGLINAYRCAAEDSINNAVIVQKIFEVVFEIKFDYSMINNIMHIIKKEKLNIIFQNFSENCIIHISVKASLKTQTEEILRKAGVQILKL